MKIEYNPEPKQDLLFDALEDNNIREILFGGAAGGGKTWGICALLIMECIKYPGIVVGIARARRTVLKRTTFKTCQKILNEWNLVEDLHYTINYGELTIKFSGGSEIMFIDLFHYPSDDDFTKLGGLELTYGYIDEANEVSYKAKDIFISRLARSGQKWKLTPKLFMSCNPSKGWLYKDFYEPYVKGNLPPHRVFIPATSFDNRYNETYRENLEITLKGTDKERLLYGSWDLSDDDDLFTPSGIISSFEPVESKPTHMACDIARLGGDKIVTILFSIIDSQIEVFDIIVLNKLTLDIQTEKIKELQDRWDIPGRNIVFDIDGVGGGVKDYIKGSQGILNGGKAQGSENYQNLKTQLYFRLSERFNSMTIKINDKIDEGIKNKIIEELSPVKRINIYSDGKIQITNKDGIKAKIGRSPDIADCLAYCTFFDGKIGGGSSLRVLEY